MKAKRIISIDIARAVCIILVVIGHYEPDNSPEWYIGIRSIIYSFHMPLFMFVSGYIYWNTRKSIEYGSFILKKFARLMIPYFFVSIIIITLKLLSERGLYVQNPISLSAFYEMFYMPVAGIFLWFVYVLFLIFLLIPFFNTHNKLILLLVLSFALYFIPLDFPDLFCLAKLKKNLLYFVLGCTLVEYSDIRRVVQKFHLVFVLLIFAITYFFKAKYSTEIALINNLLSLIVALMGILFISNLSRYISLKTNKIKQFFIFISTCSFTIYLFHTTFEGFAKALLLKIPLGIIYTERTFVFVIFALIIIANGIIVPIIINRFSVTYSKVFSFLIGEKFIGKLQN